MSISSIPQARPCTSIVPSPQTVEENKVATSQPVKRDKESAHPNLPPHVKPTLLLNQDQKEKAIPGNERRFTMPRQNGAGPTFALSGKKITESTPEQSETLEEAIKRLPRLSEKEAKRWKEMCCLLGGHLSACDLKLSSPGLLSSLESALRYEKSNVKDKLLECIGEFNEIAAEKRLTFDFAVIEQKLNEFNKKWAALLENNHRMH